MDPLIGRITRGRTGNRSTGSIGFGAGNNFVYDRRRAKRELTSPLINSLRGKIDGNHPEIIIRKPRNKRKPAFVRFRIRKNRDNITGNERSELAVGRQFSGDETVHVGFSFRVHELDGITGNTKYIFQGWQPVEQPRFGIRINSRDNSKYDLVSRSGGGTTMGLRKGKEKWNSIIMSINNEDGITWRNTRGRILAESPGGFLSPGGRAQTWRPKFGAYGFGGNDANIDVRGFSVGSDLDAVMAGLT